ncbi:MAG: hypothetical protein ABSF18_06895 [Gammaproteobacteria bacterium]|jgi:hypothetical protein
MRVRHLVLDYYDSLAWATLILIIFALGLLLLTTFRTSKTKSDSLLKCSLEIKEKVHLLTMSALCLALITTLSFKEVTANPLHKVSNAAYEYYMCLSGHPELPQCENKYNYLMGRVFEAETYGIETVKIMAALNSGKYDALAKNKSIRQNDAPETSSQGVKPLEH